ncbi:MAG: peptide deformylase, partial [Oscillospiraceae bacterium]|nr:peptide deformylase [Oscillospiraceae bacterium]
MALRNIYVDGDPILRKVCRPVEKFDEKLCTLLDDMHETLTKSEGVGLAAPQVGMCRRIFIMHLDEENISIEAINPEIIRKSGKQRVVEGCLSCPDKWGYVTRPMTVTLRAQDR